MVRSLQDPEHLEQLLSRLDHLRPESPRQWGCLTAPAMVCHVLDALRVALGDQPIQDRSTWFTRTVAKWAVITLKLPAPKGKVKTAPEMLLTPAGDWDRDLEALRTCIRRVGAGEAQASHPTFGALTPQEWAILAALHLDHHLQQFRA